MNKNTASQALGAMQRFLAKVKLQNEPYKGAQESKEFKAFFKLLAKSVTDQADAVADALRNLDTSSTLAMNDDLQPLNSSNVAHLRDLIRQVMPSTADNISHEKVVVFLKFCFNYSVKAQYRRWGLIVKAADVDFKVTNKKYLDKLDDQANYLLNNSSIDETTIDQMTTIISDGKSAGLTIDEVATDLSNAFQDIGDTRAMLISRTETAQAMGSANLATMTENGVQTKHWVIAGPHSGNDECDDNADAGSIPVGDSFPSGDDAEPAHPNACLGNQEIEALEVTAKMIAPYNGLAIYLTTDRGIEFAVTPKHRIATINGWVEAQHLKKGDYIISAPNGINGMAKTINPQSKPVKSLIEDVGVPGRVSFRRVPSSAKYLHGEAVSCEYVDVIFANRKLTFSTDAPFFKLGKKHNLSFRYIGWMFINSLRSAYKFFLTHLRASASSVSFKSHSFTQARIGNVGINPSLGYSPQDYTSLLESLSKSKPGDTGLWSEFLNRFASFVSVDKIVKISKRNFRGHIYDLSTKYHFYTVNSIITHNCECYTEADEIDLDSIDIWSGE